MPAEFDPFDISFAVDELAGLRDRVRATRWPQRGAREWVRGVPLEYLRELAGYWSEQYDWFRYERRLNEWTHSRTVVDGQPIHVAQVRSPEPDAVPMVMLHGWPGSIVEFLEVAGPLTDPGAHGGDPADAFHLILPSLPGYGFSTPLAGQGWTPARTASAFAEVMARLGHDRYVVQGGDWGSMIARELARIDEAHVRAVHVNTLFTFPPRDLDLAGLDATDADRVRAFRRYDREDSGYRHLQATRPRTIEYALTDSPVGQLAWIAEKFFEWTDSHTRPEEAVDRDHLLTDVTLYWLTGTAGSSAELYYEAAHSRLPTDPVAAPLAVSVFRSDAPLPVRALAERANNVVFWREHERGGHFAALEQPATLIDDIREALRPFR